MLYREDSETFGKHTVFEVTVTTLLPQDEETAYGHVCEHGGGA